MSDSTHPHGSMSELDIFAKLIEMPADQRPAELDRACGDDVEMRARLERLLENDEKADEKFLSPTPFNFIRPSISPSDAGRLVDRVVGPYRIVKRIGKGGMGEVYLASRTEGYKQNVAIKVLSPGPDNEEMVRRFHAETQFTAALGKHPNITSLIDAGTTDDGLLYLVMDFVDGKRIDDYCDFKKLTNEQRIELFLSVCDAVQFAHQNTVIHRDLKPSNILVTHEGEVRLIDFGIAKLMNPQLGFQSESTRTLFRVLTPAYASPEQARGEPPTTASDVYSLGVILYLVLSGRSPYEVDTTDPQKLANTIENVQPPPPKVAIDQLTQTGESSTVQEIAQKRGVTLDKLRRQLDGDLGNIVLMALRKEPERRYGTVQQLADDLRRYLTGHPVRARKDTIRYRTQKFVRRNRFAVVMGSVLVLSLLAGIAGTSTQWLRAQRATVKAQENADTAREEADRANQLAQQEAEARIAADQSRQAALASAKEAKLQAETAQQVSDFMIGLFQGADQLGLLGYQFGSRPSQSHEPTARELLDLGTKMLETKLQDQPAVRASLMTKIAQIYLSMGSLAEAEPLMQESLAQFRAQENPSSPNLIDCLATIGLARWMQGNFDASIKAMKEAIALSDNYHGKDSPEGADYKLACGFIVMESNQPGEWAAGRNMVREAVAIRRAEKNPKPLELGYAIIGEAIVLRTEGYNAQASLSVLEGALHMKRSPHGGMYADAFALAVDATIKWQGSMAARTEAHQKTEEVIRLTKEILGEKHPIVNYLQIDQAKRMFQADRFVPSAPKEYHESEKDKAELLMREGVTLAEESYGRQPRTAYSKTILGWHLLKRNHKLEEAEELLREAVDIYIETIGESNPRTIYAMKHLATALELLTRNDEAVALRRRIGTFDSK